MAAFGNLQIDCSCGVTLSVPVTVEPGELADEPNTLTGTFRIDHAFIAAHMATHDGATPTGFEGRAASRS